MDVTPLTAEQGVAVDALVEQHRIEAVTADVQRASRFLARAVAASQSRITHPEIAYNVSYDACHDVGEAVLAAYGFRTLNGPGQHIALGQFLTAVFDAPPGRNAARRFDQLRRARNQNRYEATPVGRAQADLAASTARDLIAAAKNRGITP